MDATNTSTAADTEECQHCEHGRIFADDRVYACECSEGQDVAAEWNACESAW